MDSWKQIEELLNSDNLLCHKGDKVYKQYGQVQFKEPFKFTRSINILRLCVGTASPVETEDMFGKPIKVPIICIFDYSLN